MEKKLETGKKYEKPQWRKEPMFERFALACCQVAAPCATKAKSSGTLTS
jgi:hypothetical protein